MPLQLTRQQLGTDDSRFFFVLGAPRSGTTMFRLLLNHHSQPCVPPESWFFPLRFPKVPHYGDFSQPGQIEEFALDVATTISESDHPISFVCNVTSDEIAQAVRAKRADNYAKAYAAFMSYIAEREHKQIWGDKTPYHTAFVNVLAHCFPNAKFISLLRDPRDVVASILNTSWGKRWYSDLVNASIRWLY